MDVESPYTSHTAATSVLREPGERQRSYWRGVVAGIGISFGAFLVWFVLFVSAFMVMRLLLGISKEDIVSATQSLTFHVSMQFMNVVISLGAGYASAYWSERGKWTAPVSVAFTVFILDIAQVTEGGRPAYIWLWYLLEIPLLILFGAMICRKREKPNHSLKADVPVGPRP